MKLKVCSYPVDWDLHQILVLPVFEDQLPPQGSTGRIDFRLQGLITGMILENLFSPQESWLLMNLTGKLAEAILLAGAGKHQQLNLDRVANWSEEICRKVVRAGGKFFSLAIDQLYQDSFFLKDYSEALLKAFLPLRTERINLYCGEKLAPKLAQELERWLHHLHFTEEVELEISWSPEVLGRKER